MDNVSNTPFEGAGEAMPATSLIPVPLQADDERFFICHPNRWLRLRRTTPSELEVLGYGEKAGWVNVTLAVKAASGDVVPVNFPYPEEWPLEDADEGHCREMLERFMAMDEETAATLRLLISGTCEGGVQ